MKRPSISNLCVSLSGDHYLRAARQEAVGDVYITRTLTITSTAAPNSNSVATAGAVATPVATTIVATATDTVTKVALPRAEPRRQSQPTVFFAYSHRPCPGCSGYCLGRLCYCSGPSACCFVSSHYCSACSNHFLGCSYVVQRHRVASIGHRLLVFRRLQHSGPTEVHHDFGLRDIVEFCRQPLHWRHRVADEDILKVDPPVIIVVAGHTTLSGVSMGTLTHHGTTEVAPLPKRKVRGRSP